jgi:UDP-2-acetamido-3-amino-2,3-dideoxy-glucuronate N-acetyltransferase
VVCGHEIGAYSLIGAGAVITRDVKPFALVIGNPGRQTAWVSEYGHKLAFDDEGIAVCHESGQKYRLSDNSVTRII